MGGQVARVRNSALKVLGPGEGAVGVHSTGAAGPGDEMQVLEGVWGGRQALSPELST